jgi:hypothetical protein
MTRFDGTAARQLDLIDTTDEVVIPTRGPRRPFKADIRLLKQDVYVELMRRRRRAQIAARHALERAERSE